MNNYNTKAILKKYRLCLLGVFGVFVAIAIIMLVFTDNNFLYGLSLLLGFVSIKISGAIFYNKFFNSILTNELNLPKYIDLIETGKIVSNSLLEHLNIAYYSGDYNKVINICKIKLENKKFEKVKHFYLLMLARSYFEIGDLGNLKTVNEMFKSFIATNKNGNKIKEKLIYFKFVDLYLSGDFSTAKELYEKLYSSQKENQSKVKLNDVSIRFTFAICCYKCGEFAKATELFNDVIALAPTFHYAEIAKGYLEAINNNTDYIPERITFDTDTTNIPIPKSRKKFKIIYAICFSLILIGVIGSAIISATAPKQPMHFKGIDYYSTKSNVHSIYGKPDEIREYDSFEGQYYDFYNVEYLGVKATLQFTYYFDSDILHSSWFTIDSTRFSSYDEYKSAVNRTYDYFEKTLAKYRIEDESDENGRYITWFNDKGGYSYSMFETELTFSKEENDIRECTVFEFCKYSE